MAEPSSASGATASACFDERRSRHPTQRIAVEEVIDLLAVPHAPERIEEYRQAMLRGERFPPVSVVRLVGRVFLADGHKRLSAYRGIGGGEIPVEVWPIRRWLGDQLGQFRRKAGLQARLLLRSVHDPRARVEARALGRHFVTHWRRIARSLRARLRRGAGD